VFLVALHLNFSVAVWVGFIALFGTQSDRRRDGDLSGRNGSATAADGTLTRAGLHTAVMEGALRLG
jgi:hypothetical protein